MSSTQCIRCGKDRILAKKWIDKTSNNVIKFESYVCPDAECQKIVDAKFAEIAQRRLDAENRKANLNSKKT